MNFTHIVRFGMVFALMTPGVWSAETRGFTADQLAHLERDGFCITKQDSHNLSAPPFVTSDSVLALFHRFLRETILKRDDNWSKSLQANLKGAWENLEQMKPSEPGADPAICSSALERARIVCGTALRLLDPDWHPANSTVWRTIEEEAKRVEGATEDLMPTWVGVPDPELRSIDYKTYKPVGLHAGTPEWDRYFRAVRFLQTIPFRLDRKNELFSACYLRRALRVEGQNTNAFDQRFRWNRSIGEPSKTYVGTVLGEDKTEQPPLRGLLGVSMDLDSSVLRRPNFKTLNTRLIVSIESSELPLLEFAMNHPRNHGNPNALPDPLLASAWFGDEDAKSAMIEHYPGIERLFAPPAETKTPNAIHPESAPLFEAHVEALRALHSKPDAAAPDFMNATAWRLKTRQTTLASWTRMRNCFALDSIGARGFGGGPSGSKGFVEPRPEFYQKMARIATSLGRDLLETDPLLAARWIWFAGNCSQLEAMAQKQLRGIEWNELDEEFLGDFGTRGLMMEDEREAYAAAGATAASGTTLIIATGLPADIWVNYPWKGKKVLCKGSVMTFYSFNASEPMNDDEWREKLEASPAPTPPEWLKPLGTP